MVWSRERRKQVWVSKSHLVTLAGGTFLACRAWIKLTWARAQVPFSHTEGESEICQQYPRKIGEEKWEELSIWRSCLQGWGRKHQGGADLKIPGLSLGCPIPSQKILPLQRTPQNDFHKMHPTSAQCKCVGINKKVLVNRAKLWNSITDKFSFFCPRIYWENVATFTRAVTIPDKLPLRSRMWW